MALSKITNGGVATSGIPAGGVIQVQTFQRTTSFEQSTHGSMADCGVSVNITPTSTSNKIFIMVSGMIGNDTAGNTTVIHLLRDSTKIAAGSGANDANYNASAFTIPNPTYQSVGFNITHLDSPATTSQITYKLQLGCFNGDGFLGQRGDGGDQRVPTTITVMEIAG
jgi:hypothetical protein